jgi:hypothetical protein
MIGQSGCRNILGRKGAGSEVLVGWLPSDEFELVKIRSAR